MGQSDSGKVREKDLMGNLCCSRVFRVISARQKATWPDIIAGVQGNDAWALTQDDMRAAVTQMRAVKWISGDDKGGYAATRKGRNAVLSEMSGIRI